jgi:leader peptidase (prepilin peptidase)/N-methyltransferase
MIAELTWFHFFFAGVLGALIGSFLNVVILRWPRKMAWEWRTEALSWLSEDPDPALGLPADPQIQQAAQEALARHHERAVPPGIVVKGSHCPHCLTPLRWHDNLPLVGWLMLAGKCRSCKAPISVQYPLVEAAGAALAVLAVATFGWSAGALAASAFLGLLLTLAVIDARTMYLPDELVLPGLWTALAWSWAAQTWWPGQAITLDKAVLGAVLGYGGLALVARLYSAVRGREGMGGGDLKLLGVIGAFLGPGALIPVIGMAAVGGIATGVILQAKRGESKPFPFGPWLALAAAIWCLLGQPQGWEQALLGPAS